MPQPVFYNIDKWVQENEQYFLPPVCNKMMHNAGQLKVFYVGGPNQRKDYHIEIGEELFYMRNGDMVLKVLERGIHKDIHIREGEIFLLPGRIPHSPQRQADTIGLVFERERHESEIDGLRYFVEIDNKPTTDSLFERWFHCVDLGVQLGPVIKEFFASEQCRTGKPIPEDLPEKVPVELDTDISLDAPFNLHIWINEHREEIKKSGKICLFGKGCQFQIDIIGKGETSGCSANAETFIWQIEGSSIVTADGEQNKMSEKDTLLIPTGQKYSLIGQPDCVAMVIVQEPLVT